MVTHVREILVAFLTIVVLSSSADAQLASEQDPASESTDAEPGSTTDAGPSAEQAVREEAPIETVVETETETVTEEESSGAEAFFDYDDGAGVRSVDRRRVLRISPLFAVRGVIDAPEGADADGEARIRLARVVLMGHLADGHVRYFFQLEGAGDFRLLDLEIAFVWRPELQVRIGRFRTGFSRQFIAPLTNMQLPVRSIVSDFSRADRDTGLSVEGRALDGRLEYRLGVFDERLTATPLVVGRVAFDPFGEMAFDETAARVPEGPTRLSVGLAAYHGGRQTEQTVVGPMGEVTTMLGPEIVRSAIGLDAALRIGPVHATAEAFLDRREDPMGNTQVGAGAFAQAGVFVWPRFVEVVARYDWLTPDESASLRGLQRAAVGGNLYLLDGRAKLQASYVYTDVDTPIAGQLAAFTGHMVDLQALLWF